MAIALLPLKEGETLGSNFGRYAELMGLKATWRLRQSLFGCSPEPGSRLPTAIDHLAQQVRDYWNLTAEEIVKRHTEFQYSTMMASESLRETLLQVMLAPPSGERFAFPMRIYGLKGERTGTLRYCETCLAESIEQQQTPYWRIDHQLAGVYCCVKHGCILKSVKRVQSERYFDQTVFRLVKKSDEMVLQRVTPQEKYAVEDIAKRSVLQRVEWGGGQSRQVYRDMLMDAGFVRTKSQIKFEKVIFAWFEYFGPEYCHVTNMTSGRISKWLHCLSESHVRSECPHPFIYIAAASFLEHCVKSSGSYIPQIRRNAPAWVGEGAVIASALDAYTCTGALHRRSDFLEFVSLRRDRWKLVCTCGISYRLVKADLCDVVKLLPIAYGDRYRNRYCALIAKGLNLSSAAQTLRLSINVGIRWAYEERAANIKLLPCREINKLHSKWRWLVKNAPPERPITAAAEADPAVYKALLKNDPNWLRTFNQNHRSPGRTKGAVRLKEPTPDQIREAWRGLISAVPPMMATRSAILERAGFPRVTMGRNRSFEPVLMELVECRPAYLERVISWLANLASGHRLGDCDEAMRTAGLRRTRFTKEQRDRIRSIELTNPDEGHSTRKY
ncbi:TnsD family Tn7-like transposition protein [Paraburkholderia sabiae]|uniref:TnsD family Tn7-like transposition protein n=1 Tax=Paraburkholderia sabiae TaxID=273251 RepID=A0ABU9QLJ1_9BURK|nr:TnsD family Tn7-like transposition protein [Paraburkholderia sabiae]WJZ76461.1 TnsD family Tn7-like transposition protein [Paraburkholderia sabiae]CAD6560117.1 hypothetical protein LMG24235_06848 [Paraburkholderia sabiae]